MIRLGFGSGTVYGHMSISGGGKCLGEGNNCPTPRSAAVTMLSMVCMPPLAAHESFIGLSDI